MSKVQSWLLANDRACQHGSNYFHFSFFLGAVFYMLRLRSGTDLITCESELHGWVSRMPCPMLSHMGIGGTAHCQLLATRLCKLFYSWHDLQSENPIFSRVRAEVRSLSSPDQLSKLIASLIHKAASVALDFHRVDASLMS